MNLTGYIRKNGRKAAMVMLLSMVINTASIIDVHALTSGPTQPEVQSFEPAGTTDMVDMFTGDFTYNIPLFELPGPNGGYPFNLAYHAGISTDQEASWVGLGWNLAPGAINRQMRGLPDEFNGDEVESTQEMEDNLTMGLNTGLGLEVFGAAGELGQVGGSVYFNTYRGLGYSISGMANFPLVNKDGPLSANLGFGFNADSQEGISYSPSLSLTLAGEDGRRFGSNIRLGYNSRMGLQNMSYGLSYSQLMNRVRNTGRPTNIDAYLIPPNSFNSSLSFASSAYTPQVSMPTVGTNSSINFSVGASAFGAYPKFYVGGYFNREVLRYDAETRKVKAYGYMNLQYASEEDMLDFNREKDGVIREESPNLPIPIPTPDVYAISGQGIGGTFRVIRNDLGALHDQASQSISVSSALGFDISPVFTHTGANLTLFHGQSRSGRWNHRNVPYFEGQPTNSTKEAWHFQVHGEHTNTSYADFARINSEEPLQPSLSSLDNVNLAEVDLPSQRKSRAQVIQSLTNEEIRQATNGSALMITRTSGIDRGDREKYPDHHVGAFIITKDDGTRYVYALPTYNRSQVEVSVGVKEIQDKEAARVATIDESERIKTTTVLPAYAYSHLLTAVIGPDYVDVLEDGVSEDDLGYWVKFTYEEQTQSGLYRWRTPFVGGQYNAGYHSDNKDDRATYMHGAKEIWYLKKAETKSHEAEFFTSEREDARGVTDGEIGGALGERQRKLDRIRLNVRGSLQPLQQVVFDNDNYRLCPGTENSTAVGDPAGGKLTLDGLHFEYGASDKRIGQYKFEYFNEAVPFHEDAHDRWGYYRTPEIETEDGEFQRKWPNGFPYVDQGQSAEDIASQVATWSLSAIDLPTGGRIEVEYESDDYGYVQHKRATQMVPIVAADLIDGNGKISFELEKPFEGDDAEDFIRSHYLDLASDQIYVKAYTLLKGTDNYDYVSGFVKLDESKPIGVEGETGFFHVKLMGGDHPLRRMAWQHMKLDQPKLTYDNPIPEERISESFDVFKQLALLFGPITNLFTGFNTKARIRGWASAVDTEKSWVRLTSPDRVKYGGGLRVKALKIFENMNSKRPEVYGQVYDYTKMEDGERISSGVAAYEPLIGGEENPLRKAKYYSQDVKLQSDHTFQFEYPVNESNYPGASVGYSKVTVMSLAASARSGGYVPDPDENYFPNVKFGTTGKTEYEFYTARDFPVIATERPVVTKKKNRITLNPFIGINKQDLMTAVQSYAVVTNDMHGKPRKVSQYRQSSDDGTFASEPFDYTSYEYQSKVLSYDGELANQLENVFVEDEEYPWLVTKASDVSEEILQSRGYLMGTEYEVVADARRFESIALQGGISGNLDGFMAIFVPAFIPTAWPNVSEDETVLKTLVTNKIIFRSGILSRTTKFTDGAKVVTEDLKWDKLTGRPLLTRVTEKFKDQTISSLQVPAYTEYEGMGPAYTNSGIRFDASLVAVDGKPDEFEMHVRLGIDGAFEPGDELLLFELDEAGLIAVSGHGIYLGRSSGQHRIYSKGTNWDGPVKGTIYRSGHRNQLLVNAGDITALGDPSRPSGSATFNKTIVHPR